MRKPKIEPVPVVNTRRQTNASQPTALPSVADFEARRSIIVNRYAATTMTKPV